MIYLLRLNLTRIRMALTYGICVSADNPGHKKEMIVAVGLTKTDCRLQHLGLLGAEAWPISQHVSGLVEARITACFKKVELIFV
ncbi:hypothetical protein CKAN_00930600 [Cinnamomum micranthum f. kanehirae]|uniref:Uncharacterized protein n=1 Tax=Cinnamomum micranthum f. kanehirae TaxID=337451 RepID=A0A3S3Q791_9MAGN|nr:hypothetical protein CKAN_00930600 [Cinnamomum micranthum f. kanehirae]